VVIHKLAAGGNCERIGETASQQFAAQGNEGRDRERNCDWKRKHCGRGHPVSTRSSSGSTVPATSFDFTTIDSNSAITVASTTMSVSISACTSGSTTEVPTGM